MVEPQNPNIPTPSPPSPKSPNMEPVLYGIGALDLCIGAGLGMSNALGWTDLSVPQLGAISAFVLAVSGTVAGIIRSAVTPVAKLVR